MNSDNLTQLLQQGFRLTLGATASLVETLQNAQKRNENLTQIQSELEQLATDWVAKGEITEQEARKLVDNLLNQLSNQQSTPTSEQSTYYTSTTTSTTVAPPHVQLELQELTAQIAAIRSELERLNNSSDSNQS